MNISLKPSGIKSIKRINIRLHEGKFDVSAKTHLMVAENDWDYTNQSSKDLELEEILQSFKLAILKRFNVDLSKGVVIDAKWLASAVKLAQSRPKDEDSLMNENCRIYISDFAKYWLDNYADKWKVSSKSTMGNTLKGQYAKFLQLFLKYEGFANEKFTLKDFTQDRIYEFVEWLQEEEKYAIATVQRITGRLRFWFNRAIQMKLEVCEDFKLDLYFDEEESEEEIEGIYLSESEIDKIFNLDLSHDDDLDNVRDNLLISVWTGLRISDFMFKLKTDNIKNGFISIKTTKTGAFVKLPVHFQVKSVLDKRFGQLPRKISASEYNKQVKIVAQLANIDNVVFGKLWNPETKRKEKGYYPKWAFCSSHIGRKSLATNLAGKVSKETIQSVCGWSNQSMVLFYDKTSKTTHAETVQNVWANEK